MVTAVSFGAAGANADLLQRPAAEQNKAMIAATRDSMILERFSNVLRRGDGRPVELVKKRQGRVKKTFVKIRQLWDKKSHKKGRVRI